MNTRLIVPLPDDEPWPTLGPEICDFIEDNLVHGPGDVLGEPATLTEEFRCFIYRAYEVFPRGHPQAGRRRFKRAGLSRRKGVAKTELAAWIAICELDPNAPVRCDGWREEHGVWVPVGRPVRDPYIPMLAVTEEQTEELAFGAVCAILENCALGEDYLITQDRVEHGRAPGKIVPVAGAPGSRDGARTTFEHFDEPHRYTSPRQKNAHQTMLENLPKRKASDPWALETSTFYAPGEGSTFEETHQQALEILAGKIKDPRLLFDHRQADDRLRLTNRRDLERAVKQASGDAWPFTDLDAIVTRYMDLKSKGNEPRFRRFWLNQPVKDTASFVDISTWDRLASRKRGRPPAGTAAVIAFDGSYSRDSTALVGATIEPRPHIWLEQVWERPYDSEGRPDTTWRTPKDEVEEALAAAMEYFDVKELAPDPWHWGIEVAAWEQLYGDVVVRFETNQTKRFGPACNSFVQAVADGELSHDGSKVIRRHLGNGVSKVRAGHTVIWSDHDSPRRIDAAVGAIVGHDRARWHAAQKPPRKPLYAFG